MQISYVLWILSKVKLRR